MEIADGVGTNEDSTSIIETMWEGVKAASKAEDVPTVLSSNQSRGYELYETCTWTDSGIDVSFGCHLRRI